MAKTLLYSTTDLNSIFDLVKGPSSRMELAGRYVSLRRMECFAVKGTACVQCGINGTELRLEEHSNGGGTHLDLYAYQPNGGMMLMTIDHIHPKSKGGLNELSNYQPMCYDCNQKKGNKIIPNLLWHGTKKETILDLVH